MEMNLLGLISSIAASIAVLVSILTWRRTSRIASYADIDTLYLELLKLGVAHPKFTEPNLTKDYRNNFKGDELLGYQIYAFISWNICETIYDRCGKGQDKHLWCTWEPVIVSENKVHRKWFDDPENFDKFKEEFRQFMNANYPKEY